MPGQSWCAQRRTRIVAVVVGIAALAAVVAAGWALFQSKLAKQVRARAQLGQIDALMAASAALLGSNEDADDLDALVRALAAERRLAELPGPSPALRARVRSGLHQAVYGVRERQRLTVENSAITAAFSSDGSRLAALQGDGRIDLWDR